MKDILLDENFDLKFISGDFCIGESEQQEIQLILMSFKGWWSRNPHIGVGIANQINGVLDNKFIQKLRLNLEADGFKVKNIELNEQLNIEAKK